MTSFASKTGAALGGGRMFALVGLVAAFGAAGTAQARHMPMSSHHHHSGDAQHETIDQRITMLHWALKITPAEETQWTAVAQVMRANDAAMRDLVASTKAERKASDVSALEELKTYERFNRAHLDGLKNLLASFETLYTAMPDSQKVVADHVFAHFGRDGRRPNG